MAKNRLDYQAQLSRHSHDVSAGYSSSISTGMLVPQYFDILGPGDSIYYRTHLFARLQDIVTAFLGEIDVHLDYFFVPLQMIYTPFGQVFSQTNDFISSLYSENIQTENYPTIGLNQLNVDATPFSNIEHFECEGKMMMRMLDAFNMNPYEVLNPTNYPQGYVPTGQEIDLTWTHNPMVAPWIPCAYQAIYQKYFRNDEIEKLSVKAFNVDNLYNSSGTSDNIYFEMHYAQRPADYFTKTRVSPISSAVNNIMSSYNNQYPVDGDGLSSALANVEEFLSTKPMFLGYEQFNSPAITSSSSSFSSVTTGEAYDLAANTPAGTIGFSAANIRALFAVDKFSRIYGRADKTYDDQILAHFGIKIPHDVKHDLTHLKHYHCVLQSDPIFGTANTVNSDDSAFVGTIGQVGGQGQVTLDSDQEKFTAPVHGVFMCVAHVVTKPRYTSTFDKLHLCVNRLSFPIPEFDKLGAQPLFVFEFNRAHLASQERANRAGWQNRYSQFKEKYDRASLVYLNPDNGRNPQASNNIYTSWILSRNPFGSNGLSNFPSVTSHFVNAKFFFENPHNLDSVMVRSYSAEWDNIYFSAPWLAFQTDPIIFEFKCFAKKVSWMSETGEPDL